MSTRPKKDRRKAQARTRALARAGLIELVIEDAQDIRPIGTPPKGIERIDGSERQGGPRGTNAAGERYCDCGCGVIVVERFMRAIDGDARFPPIFASHDCAARGPRPPRGTR